MIELSVALNLLSSFISRERVGTFVNPFSIVMLLFAMNGFFFVMDPLIPSNRIYGGLTIKTENYILAFSIITLLLSFAIKKPKPIYPKGINFKFFGEKKSFSFYFNFNFHNYCFDDC